MVKYKPPIITIQVGTIQVGDKMRNSNFKVTLKSYDYKKEIVMSFVDISCLEYETFRKIVDVVYPILEKEDIKKECGD